MQQLLIKRACEVKCFIGLIDGFRFPIPIRSDDIDSIVNDEVLSINYRLFLLVAIHQYLAIALDNFTSRNGADSP